MPWICHPFFGGTRSLMTGGTLCALCVSGGLLVLERRLLEVFGSISGGILLLGQFSLCRCIAVDRLVLLGRLARSVSATASLFLRLFCFKTLNFLLCLGNVLCSMLAL